MPIYIHFRLCFHHKKILPETRLIKTFNYGFYKFIQEVVQVILNYFFIPLFMLVLLFNRTI